MRALGSMIRLAKWQLDEKQRQLADLDGMRDALLGQMAQLEAEVAAEQQAAAHGETAFAYANYARAATDRRETLQRSVADVEQAIARMQDEVADAFRELKKFEVADARRAERERLTADRRMQANLDEMALNMHRRRG